MKKKLLLLFVFTHLFSFYALSQDLIMQNGVFNQCSGIFYDSGGDLGNYSSNENFETTICPQNAGDIIQLVFNQFSTQLGIDELTIYDGDDTTAAVIGTFSGGGPSNNPGTIQASSSNPTGCLTIVFTSDGSSTTTGWAADINCLEACQVITPTIDSTIPAANGSGVIEIPLGASIDFYGSAIFENDDTGASYEWDFGDGVTASGQYPPTVITYEYGNLGTFTVTFTVTDGNPTGCSESVTIQVEVLSPYIDVDQTTYTVPQLVEDVLIDSPCASVSNINWSTGTNFGQENGIGYFSALPGAFPFEAGLILVSGDANQAEGPETGTMSYGGWAGDADLENAITGLNPGDSNDATYIEFDFVPIANSISFDFLFASEEYGQYQCTFTDAFAFLLTDLTTGTTTNLAIVPGTTDVVSVLTVRDEAYNNNCNSVNANYFDSYFGTGGEPTANDPTDFRGYTTVMTAFSSVVPNNPYRIKLVIADDGDTLFDAGVFLGAGTFDLGGDLGDDVTIAAGNAICGGQPIVLDTNLPTATHTWYLDGNIIPGETGSTLNAIQDGVYSVDVVFSASCQASDSVTIEFIPNPTIQTVSNLASCGSGTSGFFDLTENDTNVLGTQNPVDFEITYHETIGDANSGTSPITDPTNYNGSDGQTIYIRLVDLVTGTCFETSSFNLAVSTPTINPVPDIQECDTLPNDGFAEFDLESQTLGILGSQPATDFIVTYYTSFNNADTSTGALTSPYTNVVSPIEPIYVRVESATDPTCFTVSAVPLFNLEVIPSDDPSFTVSPTCDGGVATITGDLGGVFTFNPIPTDGAVIDATTGDVTNGQPSTTYTIEYTTTGVCPASMTEDLTVLPLDDSSFTMAPTCDGGVATITGMLGGVFAFSIAPSDSAVIDSATGLVSGGSPDTQYEVQYTTTGCVSITTVSFTSHPLPVVIAPTALEVCDDNVPDGLTQIDLSIKNQEITGNVSNYSVSYHLTQPDADLAVSPLSIPYTNIVNNQIVYVRVEDFTTGCYDTTTLELVVEQAPTAFAPTPLEYCDPDSDGIGEFILTDSELEITGGATGLTVTYHGTMSDAQNNVNALSSPYNNVVANIQTVYVRVESSTIATDCASYVTLDLIVNPTPQIADPEAMHLCDDDTDGSVAFNLSFVESEVLNLLDSDPSNDLNPLDYDITYYIDQADAEVPTGAIATPNAYASSGQTVWIRVEDITTGCYTVTSLDLVVDPLPVLIQFDQLELCDYNSPGDEQESFILEEANPFILGGQTGISLSYYSTQLGAEQGLATDEIFSPYTNTSVGGNPANPQTIYVRAENQVTGCINTTTFDLVVNPLPSPVIPVPLTECDSDNDGIVDFDLGDPDLEDYIVNGEADIELSYHETLSDAQNDIDPITGIYSNIVAYQQVVYVRAENTITGCFTVVPLTLEALPSPVVPLDLDDYVICDDNGDGISQFDFDTVMTPQIYGLQSPLNYTLTYYESAINSELGNSPIVNTGNYTNQSNPQTIYVRLEDNNNSCVATGEFEIRVEFPPVISQPSQLSICDELDADYYWINDETAVFDLTVKDSEIVGTNPSWIVEYYETQSGAQSGTGAIPDPTMYTNTSVNGNAANPQTLYVRVTDADTGCYSFTTLTIEVLPNPTPPQDPSDIELCDDTNVVGVNDMIEFFDLTQNEGYITYGEPNVSATYYTDLSDAVSATNAIVDPTMHSNEDPDNPGLAITPQVIYVRVENMVTGCFSIVDFSLLVNPLPAVIAVPDLIECEVTTDGEYDFDLSVMTTDILNGQSSTEFAVTYHETQLEAEDNINALGSTYTNTSNPQTIYASITDISTGCNAVMSFNIEVQEGATAVMPSMEYVICDNLGDNDGLGQFNLTGVPNGDGYDYNDGITNLYDEILSQATAGYTYTISFYDNMLDAESGLNPIPNVYENTSNPQTIYVRVDNDSTVCYDITTLELRVNQLPIFNLDDSYIICVDVNGTQTIQTPPVIDTGLSEVDYSFEWTDASGVVVGLGSTYTPSVAGTYSVLVTNNVTGCQNSYTTVVEQSSPPTVEATVTTLAFSENPVIEVSATGDGQYEFSLDGGPWVSNQPNDGTYVFDGEEVSFGEHIIYARDINGCGEAFDTVTVIDYPRFLTPNADGQNDTWNIIGLSGQVGAKIYIFDRYGKLLKQLAPNGQGWDGTYNGYALPGDDYWFVVEYLEDGTEKQFRAHFSLKK